MNHIGVFFNNRIVDQEVFGIAAVASTFGDWCLTPVRCLYAGNQVTLLHKQNTVTVTHEEEYDISGLSCEKPQRNFLRVIAYTILLLPGLIVGTVFKGLGYLSSSMRERHRFAVQHYTPTDMTIGSPTQRLTLEAISRELQEKNPLNQPAKNLVIYAEKGSRLNHDLGFMRFNPQKIILDGARIVHEPSPSPRLDDTLASKNDWESRTIRVWGGPLHINQNDVTLVTQWKKSSVEAAVQDTLPRLSPFSLQRYHRVYVVE